MNQYQLIDGTKSVPLNMLPESAWTTISGDTEPDDLHKLYGFVSFLYRCVEMRANAVSSLPWYISRGGSVLWAHDSEDVPDELRFAEGLPELLWQSEAGLSLGSEAFIQKQRNRVRLLNLYWLTPWTVSPEWDEEKGLIGFKRGLKLRKIIFQPEEIIYLRLPGQHETEPRVAPAHAAMAAAGVLHNKDIFARTFFERGAIKATLLTAAGNPSPEERTRLKNWWRRAFESVGNAFSTEVVSADAITPVVVGEGLDSLEGGSLTNEMREDVATAMGVPHSMVVSNANNYATAVSDRRNYYELTIVPESVIIQRQLNRQLFADLSMRFEFRPQELDIFQEDENERADALQKYVSAKVPLDVAVQILGIDLPEGVEPSDLIVEPDTEPGPIIDQPLEKDLPVDEVDAEKVVEIQVFKRWLKKRKQPNVADFSSTILSHNEKLAIMGDATGEDAPFPFMDWEAYP